MPQAAPEPTGGRLTPVLAWLRERTRRLRQRVPLVDHGWRATEHYVEVQGSLLAAAVTYYGFLSIFPLRALAFGAVGLVARMVPDAKADLERALQEIVPGVIGNGPHQLSLATLEGTATTAAGLGALAVLYCGVSWMSDVREGLTTIFRVPRQDQQTDDRQVLAHVLRPSPAVPWPSGSPRHDDRECAAANTAAGR